MARILSVSYDRTLLETRQDLLESEGYVVASALRLSEALNYCNSGAPFDLFLLGHSIPADDKKMLIEVFRANYLAPVLALQRGGEALVRDADAVIEPNPDVLLDSVATLIRGKSTAA